MKILLVTDSIPFPAPSGRNLPMSNLFSYISEKHVVDYLFLGENDDYFKHHLTKIPKSFSNVIFLKRKKMSFWHGVYGELAGKSSGFLNYTFDFNEVEQILNEPKYDIIWTSLIGNFSFARYCIEFNLLGSCKLALGLQDLTAKNYKNHGIKFWKGFERNLSTLTKYLRSGQIEKVERKLLRSCDLVHVVTNLEAQAVMKSLCVFPKQQWPTILTLSNGVNEKLQKCQYKGVDSNVLLFMTHLQGARKMEHNWFISKVWPIIRKNTDMELWIVGTQSDIVYDWMKDERVKALGFVDSLESLFDSVCISVLPSFHHSGYINRLYDSIVAGVPVVTTSYVVSTCHGLETRRLLIEKNDPLEYAEAVVSLYEDRMTRMKMSNQCKLVAKQLPSWKQLSKTLECELLKLCK